MGCLFYGSTGYAIEIDDRSLAHLKVAILTLLRAQKSIAFTYTKCLGEGSGRDTLWITPTTEIRFHFDGSRPPRLNTPWIKAILDTATAPTGLRLVDEEEASMVASQPA